ncbi:MAG: GAF domain-containing protein, partial [Planctomycetota bacterium]
MTKSGNVSWVEDHKTSFFSDNGDFLGVDGIVLDVNKRKKAEAALKESEMKYRQLFNTVSDAIMVFDEETKVFVDVNEAALQRYGYSKEDFLQLEQPDIKAELEESQKIIHQALDGEITKIPLYYHKRSDETVFPVEISSGWFELGNRKLVCDIIRDITVRKRAEEEIQLNEARLEAMLKLSQLTQITTGEIAGFALEESARLTQSKIGFINFLSENEKYVTHAVYTKETLKQCKLPINLSAFEIDDCGLWSEAYRQRKPIIVNDYTAEHPSKSGYSDGHLQLKRFMSIPIFEGDRVVAVAALGNKQKKYNPGDVRQFRLFMEGLWQAMQRQKAQDSLRERERELTLRNKISEVFLTASGDEIYTKIIDLVLDVMESKKGYFGYIDQNGDLVCPSLTKDIWDKCMISDKNIVFHRETWGGLWGRSLLEKRTIYSNDSFKLPEGHVHLHNALATPLIHHDRLIGQLAVANKMTDYTDEDSKLLEMIALKVAPILKTMLDDQRYKSEKEKLENELRQSQKMEAIGTLAGGIAHDFNNILSAIVGYSEMALGHIAGNSRVRQHIGQVLKAGLRAKDLVKQILAISCHGKPERKPVQIQLIIKEALKLLRASLPTTIEIRQNIPTESGHVLAEPTQIHQVMMNLCTNALHAMQDKGGILKVKLASVKIGARNTAYPDLEPGPYLKLSVGDTGYGMDEDTMKRIFDPYFTTKEKDVGTGMGLAVVHGIVNNHGGTITVHSKIGEGSTFHVLLPQVEKEIGYEIESVAPLPTGNRRILFVDDEKALADLGKHMLEDLGYKVDIRVSSIEALELFKVRPHRFDLVITDMTMPNMTGDKLAGKLMAISPDIPIILCTGY